MMNQILTCPHCGPTLTQARLRCDRCGRELVYIDEFQFTGHQKETESAEDGPAVSRNAKFWFGVAASVAVVVAMAGLMKPGAPTPSSPASPASPAAAPFAPSPATPPGMANRAEPRQAAEAVEAFKPGDLGQALDHYRAALAEKPADAELLDNVGRILVAMNRPAEAVPFLRQAVEAGPFSVTARFDLAVAHARCGQPKEAVEQYEALVQSGSADIRVYHNLGLALRQLGRNAEAAAAFERATALSPDQARGWLGLALSLEADGRGPEAATALERYLALEPGGADADNVRARIARLRAAAEPASAPPDTGNDASRRRP
jgi:Tfp pilus assembly protein PilF